MKNEFTAWAIETGIPGERYFIGRYAYIELIPDHMRGCRIALFATRQEAREQKIHKKTFRVVKVNVSVEEVKKT